MNTTAVKTNYNFLFTLLLFLVGSSAAWGQSSLTKSPFSNQGIGIPQSFSTYQNDLMGGLAATLPENGNVSLLNPASLAYTQHVSFRAGATISFGEFILPQGNFGHVNANFDRIYLALPLVKGKLGFNLGALPYTAVGYSFKSFGSLNGENYSTTYSGNGGLYKAFLGIGGEVLPGLSVGLNSSFIFGDVYQGITRTFDDIYNFRYVDTTDTYYRGWQPTLSVQYSKQLKEKFTVSVFGFAELNGTFSGNERRVVANARRTGGGGYYFPDSIIATETDKKLNLPLSYGGGFAIGNPENWQLGAQYRVQQWSDFEGFIQNHGLNDLSEISVGGYFQGTTERTNEIRSAAQFKNYLMRTRYFAGVRYQMMPFNYNNPTDGTLSQVPEIGTSFGFALPITKRVRGEQGEVLTLVSTLTIGGEYIWRNAGTDLEENYFNLRVGFNLQDEWFKKRKYQ